MQETATINQSMVVYTITNNDIPNHSGQNVVDHSFFTTISTSNKIILSVQDHCLM